MKFSLNPPLMNEPCTVQCYDGVRTHSYEMRSDPEFTDAELEDIQPEIRAVFREWLAGAQDRYSESGVLGGGIYGVTHNSGDSATRPGDREEDTGSDDDSEPGDEIG